MTTEVTRLASGNVGIVFPNRDICDPAFISAKNLTSMGQEQFDCVMEWVSDERAKRAEREAEHEALMAEVRERIQADAEARAAATEALKAAEPWRFA
jgi:hypothetical protein